VKRIKFFSCCWKATPIRAFYEFLYEFLQIFLISENSLRFANFFCWGNEFSIYGWHDNSTPSEAHTPNCYIPLLRPTQEADSQCWLQSASCICTPWRQPVSSPWAGWCANVLITQTPMKVGRQDYHIGPRKVFRIGTVRYNWPMSAHASQAFSIAHCTDSEDLPGPPPNKG